MPEEQDPGKKSALSKHPEVLIGAAGVLVSFLIYRRMKAGAANASVTSDTSAGTPTGGGTDTSGFGTVENQLAGLLQQFQAQQGQEASDVSALRDSQVASETANAGILAQIGSTLAALSDKVAAIGSNPVPGSGVSSGTAPVGTSPGPSYNPPVSLPHLSQSEQAYGIGFSNRSTDAGSVNQPWAPVALAGGIVAPHGGELEWGDWHNGVLVSGAYKMPDGSLRRVSA